MTRLGEPDRGLRERAWRALASGLAKDRQAIDRIWVELLDVRSRLARNAGFDDYRAFRWKELGRFDYTPDDCKAFHAAIQSVVVPAAERMNERRKASLSIDSTRVWDDFWFQKPDSFGRAALKPFRTVDELTATLERVFMRLDPSLGAYFKTLRDEGLLDLESRPHKAQGGYMEEYPASRRAFIFANVDGAHRDVVTLLHESGHTFHLFEAFRWPYHIQFMLQHMPTEFIEVASMAMELLASPYLTEESGGFYSRQDAIRAQVEHLETILGFFPYMAVVDAFQHWVYENPEAASDTSRCDQAWAALHRQYLPWLDWSGAEDTLDLIWRLQDHILASPFYYVEYGMAQLGAIQVWANSLEDHAAAVRAYRSALSLGNTASLPDLYEAAGGEFRFDRETLTRAVNLVESTIDELNAAQKPS
jgi:oligoendopeptidase F